MPPIRGPEPGREGNRPADDAEGAAAATRWDELADQACAVREDDGTGDRLGDTEADQEREARRQRGAERGDTEDGQPTDDERTPAVPITELPGHRLDDGEREQVRGDEPPDRADRRVEVVDDVRQRDRDHRRVERCEKGAERNGDQHRALGAPLAAHASTIRTLAALPPTSTGSCA